MNKTALNKAERELEVHEPGSSYDRQHVTWALNGLIREGHVKRHLHGKPSDTRFTLVEA